MGKGRGLWVPVYAEAFEHEKILEAASVIEGFLQEANQPFMPCLIPDAVVGMIVRAHTFMLERFSPDGAFRIKNGEEHRFVAMAWPAYPVGVGGAPPVLEAFVQSGLVEVVAQGARKTTFRLHEYEIHNRELLRKRPSYVAYRKKQGAAVPPAVPPAPDAATDPRRRDSKTVTGKRRTPESVEPPTEALGVARYLLDAIRSHNPKFACTPGRLKEWSGHIDRAMRLDKRDALELEQVIDWAHRGPRDFWRPNLLSGKKLRSKFDTIWGQMQRRGDGPTGERDAADGVRETLDALEREGY